MLYINASHPYSLKERGKRRHRSLSRANLIQHVAERMDRDRMRRGTGRPLEGDTGWIMKDLDRELERGTRTRARVVEGR